MKLSMTQAAKHTGKSRATIFRMIKSGKLSAEMTDAGTYQIDTAELFRVFPAVPRNVSDTDEMKRNDTAETEMFNRLIGTLQEQVVDLRRRLDLSEAERTLQSAEIRRLTLLLMPPAPDPDRVQENGAGAAQVTAKLQEAANDDASPQQPAGDHGDQDAGGKVEPPENFTEQDKGGTPTKKGGLWKRILFKKIF